MNEIYLYKKSNSKEKNINVGLSYPSTYYYGMSVVGYLAMFKEFDINKKVNAERIFLNSNALGMKPKKLDLFGFSCVFELDILQILKVLKKYNIPLFASKRKKKTPLVFAGGPVITSNPEPFAEFFDFMIIGDGEKIADEITNVYLKNKEKTKEEILYELAKIDGIYVPSLYKAEYDGINVKSFLPVRDDVPRFLQKRTVSSKKCLYSPIISDSTFYADTVFIELVRGCPFECKFCTAHWHNIPFRCFDFEYVKKTVKKVSKYAKKIVFIGAMITAHPDFDELCLYLTKLKQKRNFQVEFSSLSFDFKSKHVADLLDDKTISLSVECGTEELRKKCGKNLTDVQIYETIDYYSNQGIEKFNLYYMIGLPDETTEDIDKYIKFSVKLANDFSKAKFCHIISTFNPKPATPFENEKKQARYILNSKLEKIEKCFSESAVEMILPIVTKDAVNTLISNSDRRFAYFLKYVFEKNIPIKNIFKEYRKFTNNKKTKKKTLIPHYSNYLYRRKEQNEHKPWDFVKFC